MTRYLKRLGVAGLLFFTLKGCFWLGILALAWLGVH